MKTRSILIATLFACCPLHADADAIASKKNPVTIRQAEPKMMLGAIATDASVYYSQMKHYPNDLKDIKGRGSWTPSPAPQFYLEGIVCPARGTTSLDHGAPLRNELAPMMTKIMKAFGDANVDCKAHPFAAVAVGAPDPKKDDVDVWMVDEKGVVTALHDVTGASPPPVPMVPAEAAPAMLVSRADLHFDTDKTTAGEVVDLKSKSIEGVSLENVAPDSTFTKLGFKNHDVLLAVNGHPMRHASDLKLIATSSKVAKIHEYKVRRGENEMTWKIEFTDAAPVKELKPERTITLKRESLKKLESEPDSARVTPVYEPGGKVKCFRFVNVTPNSVFKRAGVVPGDCVISVNGRKLDSPTSTLEMYDQMRAQMAPVVFELDRKGDTHVYKIEFN